HTEIVRALRDLSDQDRNSALASADSLPGAVPSGQGGSRGGGGPSSAPPAPAGAVSNFFAGDSEWLGLAERPSQPHSSSNAFLGRYANIVVPGSNLDLAYAYSASTATPAIDPTTGLPAPIIAPQQGGTGWGGAGGVYGGPAKVQPPQTLGEVVQVVPAPPPVAFAVPVTGHASVIDPATGLPAADNVTVPPAPSAAIDLSAGLPAAGDMTLQH